MKTRSLITATVAVAIAGAVLSPLPVGADEAWRKAAQLGEFTAAKQDWAAIEAAAKKEGKVVIYSVSSRVNRLAKAFKTAYGIEVIGHDISSEAQVEKLRREQNAKIYNVDVIYNNETPVMLSEMMPKGMMYNFVPDTLGDLLEPNEKTPMLTHRWSSRILFYNSSTHPDGPPIDNLWDLTKPEWRGRFQMPDPVESSVQAGFIQTILDNPDAMAKAYEQEFGKPITYSPQVLSLVKRIKTIKEPNASLEWLRQILANKPVYVSSTNKVFENVATVGQKTPPVGIVTFSKLRDTAAGKLEAKPAVGVKPTFGVAYPTVLMIANKAPNPNAAKLLIRFMMEREGFQPWNVIGDYSARHDIEAEQAKQYNIPKFAESSLMQINSKSVYDTRYTFLQIYSALK